MAVGVDVTRAAEVEAMVRTALDAFGHVDILVNNAEAADSSAWRTSRKRARSCGIASSDRISKACFRCCRAIVPHMKSRRYGRIVNLSSAAVRGSFGPLRTVGARLPYSAAKSRRPGPDLPTRQGSGPFNITVNVVVPGFTLTEPGSRVHGQFAELDEEDRRA